MVLILAVGLTACGPHMYSTRSNGQDDTSYLIVVRNEKSYTSVVVTIDDASYTIDKIYKTKNTRKAKPILITPGKHHVVVEADGVKVKDENIFIGLQETHKIILE